MQGRQAGLSHAAASLPFVSMSHISMSSTAGLCARARINRSPDYSPGHVTAPPDAHLPAPIACSLLIWCLSFQ